MKYAYANYSGEIEIYRYLNLDSLYSWWGYDSVDWSMGASGVFGERVAKAAYAQTTVRPIPDSGALLYGCDL